MGRRHRPAVCRAPGIECIHVVPEAMLGAQRGAFGGRQVLLREHRQHAVADQLQHLAPGIVDGVDRGLRIIVEEWNDLAGLETLADRGRAAQIGKPQHRVDTFGDAARDFSAQHLLGGVAAEIDPAERPGDIDLSGGFDRKPQHRHEVAQRRQLLLMKTRVAAGRPVGIEAVHLPHRPGLAEFVNEGDEMLVTFVREFADHREVEFRAIGEIDHKLVVAVFEHVVESGTAPVLRRIALTGRSVFETIALIGLAVVPAETAPLENRVQGVDEGQPPRQIDAAGAATLAKAADQIVSGQARQPLADQPVHQAQAWREFHAAYYAAQSRRVKGWRRSVLSRMRDGLAVFLDERRHGMIEQIEHHLRRPA